MSLLFLPLLCAALSSAITWGVGFHSLRRALRHNPHLHWTERARLAWPGRALYAWQLWAGTASLAAVSAWTAAPGQRALAAGIAIAAALAVSLALSRGLARLLGFVERPWPQTLFRGLAMMGQAVLQNAGLIGAPLAAGYGLKTGHGAWSLLALLPLPLLLTRLRLLLLRPLGLLTRPDARLQGWVDAAVKQVGVQPRVVDLLESDTANAFAFFWSRSLLVTRRAMDVLTDAQGVALIAHELGHLTEPWRVRLIRLLPLAVLTLGITGAGLASRRTFVLGLGVWMLVFGLTSLAVQRLARRMETRADQVAHEVGGPDYARALERLYEVNLLPAVQRGGSHPSLYERMTASGVTPDWPRPAPPSRAALRVGMALQWIPILAWIMHSVGFPAMLRIGL